MLGDLDCGVKVVGPMQMVYDPWIMTSLIRVLAFTIYS